MRNLNKFRFSNTLKRSNTNNRFNSSNAYDAFINEVLAKGTDLQLLYNFGKHSGNGPVLNLAQNSLHLGKTGTGYSIEEVKGIPFFSPIGSNTGYVGIQTYAGSWIEQNLSNLNTNRTELIVARRVYDYIPYQGITRNDNQSIIGAFNIRSSTVNAPLSYVVGSNVQIETLNVNNINSDDYFVFFIKKLNSITQYRSLYVDKNGSSFSNSSAIVDVEFTSGVSIVYSILQIFNNFTNPIAMHALWSRQLTDQEMLDISSKLTFV